MAATEEITMSEKQGTYNTKDGYVYIMKPVHSNVYKIGETVNLEQRIKTLGRKFNFKLEYVYTKQVRDCFGWESALHLRYSNYHIGGDWFALDENALAEIIETLEGVE